MAVAMAWLSELGSRVGIRHKRSHASDTKNQARHSCRHEPTLGILAFEVARTMSRLISLYRSLSDEEVLKLRKEVMKTQGVSYLNSNDESFLLKLACAERIEDLDRAAVAVARLGKKCSDPELNRFEYIYADLKIGLVDLCKLDFVSKGAEKIIDKMEKFIRATSGLHAGLEALSDLEVSERKQNRWKNNKAPIPSQKPNSNSIHQKLTLQRQHVQQLREVSLWNQTFDKTVGNMARIVCIVYARICIVFGPYISVIPAFSSRYVRNSSLQIHFNTHDSLLEEESSLHDKPVKAVIISKSGPIPKPQPKQGFIQIWSRETKPIPLESIGYGMGFHYGTEENQKFGFGGNFEKTCRLKQQARTSTVGGSGLEMRYANVIIQVEKYVKSPCSISDYEREDLYQMLPASLKMSVRTKLKNIFRKEGESGWWDDDSLAEGWRDGLKGILEWLAPMAHDTVRWLAQRNFEKQNFDAKPTVLLLQTLFFADREKTEAAIAEVLVALSCICRYEIHRYYDD